MSIVVVAGALANKPGSAGEAWVRMSWVRGFEQLGLEVRFAEELGEPDDAAVAWFRAVTERFGLAGRASLLHGGEALAGPPPDDLQALAPEATLVNISGHMASQPLFGAFRRRVLVDIDPGYTQVWHAQGNPGAHVDGHDLHFTIGERIGRPDCPIPTGGIAWRTVRQPVVLADWPPVAPAAGAPFTTVGSWRGAFGPLEHDGVRYGLKAHEFRRFIELPRRAPHAFELALDIHPADGRDLTALGEHGWRVVDPRVVAGTPDAFRAYVQASGAEFSVAQGVYVQTRCGWFSDRSVRYLASGRPVLVQDTGFGGTLPCGDGVVAFTTLEEAERGAADIVSRHEEHCAAARRIAEDHFAADRVLGRFCEEIGLG